MIGIWPEITFAQFPLDIINSFGIWNHVLMIKQCPLFTIYLNNWKHGATCLIKI